MKKVLLILFCLLAASALSAQAFSGWWTGGNLGFNAYFGKENDEHFLMDLDVLTFTFRQNNSGLLLSFTPLHFDSCCEESEEIQKEENIVSVVNAKIGFDLLSHNFDCDLVPYISVNWDPFKPLSAYRAETGVEFSYFSNMNLGYTFPFRVKVFSVKAACGLRRNDPYFTAGVSIDLSAAVYTILYAEYTAATNDD